MSTFCTSCGAELVDGARFCPACGAPRVEAAPQGGAQGVTPGSVPWIRQGDVPTSVAYGDPSAFEDTRTVNLGAGAGTWRPYDEPTIRVDAFGIPAGASSHGSQGGLSPDPFGSSAYGASATADVASTASMASTAYAATESVPTAVGHATTTASADTGLGIALLRGVVTRLFAYSAVLRIIQMVVTRSFGVMSLVWLLLCLAPAVLCFLQPKGFEKLLAVFPAVGLALDVVFFINANGGIVLVPQAILQTELPYVLLGVFYYAYHRACTSTAMNSAGNKRFFLVLAAVMVLLEVFWTFNMLRAVGGGMPLAYMLCMRGRAILELAGEVAAGLVLVDRAQ